MRKNLFLPAFCFIFFSLSACEKETANLSVPNNVPVSEKTTSSAQAKLPTPVQKTKQLDILSERLEQKMALIQEKSPPPKFYEDPVERRLYSSRLEASSFLWTDWNRFQENYHPNYAMDGDPKTAWTEGADTNGVNEWIRIHLSPVQDVTTLRLRIQNGYQKSKSLFAKNARIKTLQVTTLPDQKTYTTELKDEMGWQELSFDLTNSNLEGIELKAIEVFDGSKYADLCLSDLEIYVTGTTVENPDFERKKKEKLLAWKEERLAAAETWKQQKDNEALPITESYRVIRDAKPVKMLTHKNSNIATLQTIASLVPESKQATDRAIKALSADKKTWIPLQVSSTKPLKLPLVDGLYEASGEDLVYGGPSDSFMIPVWKKGSLLLSTHLTAFDMKAKPRKKRCKVGETNFYRMPSQSKEGLQEVQELIMEICVIEYTREGEDIYLLTHILEYDEKGRLVLYVNTFSSSWFTWQEGENGSLLEGGLRFADFYDKIDQLVQVKRTGE